MTSTPRLANVHAAALPIVPAPMTTTSVRPTSYAPGLKIMR